MVEIQLGHLSKERGGAAALRTCLPQSGGSLSATLRGHRIPHACMGRWQHQDLLEWDMVPEPIVHSFTEDLDPRASLLPGLSQGQSQVASTRSFSASEGGGRARWAEAGVGRRKATRSPANRGAALTLHPTFPTPSGSPDPLPFPGHDGDQEMGDQEGQRGREMAVLWVQT
jgi:hypothetical protein